MRQTLEVQVDDRYFENKDNQCFGTSLANLLLVMGDEEMARKVYADYRKHPFVLEDGSTSHLVYSRLVGDLTGNKYHARMISWGKFGETEEMYNYLVKMYPKNLIDVLEVAKEEREQDRFVLFNFEEIPLDARICPPCILSIIPKYKINRDGNKWVMSETEDFLDVGHCIVFSDKNTLVDGQFSFNYSDTANLSGIDGFLQIKKT